MGDAHLAKGTSKIGKVPMRLSTGSKSNYSGREYDVSAGGIVFLGGADYQPDSFARVAAQTPDAPRVEREERERERER